MTRDGVQVHVDLARVVAPLVVDGLLGVPMVVGAPLVPRVVNPLVVALALVAGLSVAVVSVGNGVLLDATACEGAGETAELRKSSLGDALETISTGEAEVGTKEALGTLAAVAVAEALVAVVLVVNTEGLRRDVIVLDVSLPGLSGDESGSEDERLVHCFFCKKIYM